jgi:hypothetical protein
MIHFSETETVNNNLAGRRRVDFLSRFINVAAGYVNIGRKENYEAHNKFTKYFHTNLKITVMTKDRASRICCNKLKLIN